jgi:hypothetical protein
MVSDSNPRTPISPSNPEHPIITTPIQTGSRTLYRFGDRTWCSNGLYEQLGTEMSPYFIGPMPAATFLSKFLPPSLPLPGVVPSFTEDMFKAIHTAADESQMYSQFVCP